jgi:hypothetical protein
MSAFVTSRKNSSRVTVIDDPSFSAPSFELKERYDPASSRGRPALDDAARWRGDYRLLPS